MPNTIHTVLFPDRFHCSGYQRLVAILDLTGELLGPERFEFLFYFREDVFYGVKIWAVHGVEDVPDAVLLHTCQSLFRPMSG